MNPLRPLGIELTGDDDDPLLRHFYRLNRVIPDNQVLVTVGPTTTVAEALRLMKHHSVSQLPVIEQSEVLGVFSFRSFAFGLLEVSRDKIAAGDLPVIDFVDTLHFARVTDEFDDLINLLDEDDAVLVGESGRLQALVTTVDVLRYLYWVASPYVLMAEIELAIRALIRASVDALTLERCISQSLASLYKADALPKTLEEMTFNDYVQVIGYGATWALFETAFGGPRERTRAKLVVLRDLRNDLFHFKREITIEEYQELHQRRQWLLMRSRLTQARRQEQAHVR